MHASATFQVSLVQATSAPEAVPTYRHSKTYSLSYHVDVTAGMPIKCITSCSHDIDDSVTVMSKGATVSVNDTGKPMSHNADLPCLSVCTPRRAEAKMILRASVQMLSCCLTDCVLPHNYMAISGICCMLCFMRCIDVVGFHAILP